MGLALPSPGCLSCSCCLSFGESRGAREGAGGRGARSGAGSPWDVEGVGRDARTGKARSKAGAGEDGSPGGGMVAGDKEQLSPMLQPTGTDAEGKPLKVALVDVTEMANEEEIKQEVGRAVIIGPESESFLHSAPEK